MKFCPQCGEKNKDRAKFCENCGASLENMPPAQHNTTKNTLIAPAVDLILGFIAYFLCGIGHIIYLRLYKRGIILGAAGLLISVVFGIIAMFNDSLIVTALSLMFGIILTVYAALDAYKCSQAINNGSELPMLFGFLNPEGLSRGAMIGVGAVCIIGIAALAGSIFIAVDSEMSDSNISDDSHYGIGTDKTSGVQVKITYPNSWSASIGDSNSTEHFNGKGNRTFNIDEDEYKVIAAAVTKKDGGSETIKVEIIKNGNVLNKDSTTKGYGTVSASARLD